MFTKHPKLIGCAMALAIGSTPLLADFSYQENSQVTGGSMLGVMKFAGTFAKKGQKPTDPTLTTVSVKGHRMVRRSPDHATVTDLDQQTITSIHYAKKTYSVLTFAQMKQQLADASAKLQSNADAQKTNASFDVKVNDTGQVKDISGNQAHEMVVNLSVSTTDPNTGNTATMNVVSDMWIAPGIAGYDEVRAFNKRMAEEIGWTPSSNPMLDRPDVGKAMTEMYKEGSKLTGVPLETVVKMTGAAQPDGQQSGDAGNQTQATPPPTSMSGALGDAFGSHFGLGRHKKHDDSDSTSANSSGSLIEVTNHVTSFNSAEVDPGAFEIPAGFAQVEEPATSSHHRR